MPDVSTGTQASQPAVSHRGASGKGAGSRSAVKGLARGIVRPGLGPSRPRGDVAKHAYPEGRGQWAVFFSRTALAWNKTRFPKIVFNSYGSTEDTIQHQASLIQ